MSMRFSITLMLIKTGLDMSNPYDYISYLITRGGLQSYAKASDGTAFGTQPAGGQDDPRVHHRHFFSCID
jgi:hypothetical protein